MEEKAFIVENEVEEAFPSSEEFNEILKEIEEDLEKRGNKDEEVAFDQAIDEVLCHFSENDQAENDQGGGWLIDKD